MSKWVNKKIIELEKTIELASKRLEVLKYYQSGKKLMYREAKTDISSGIETYDSDVEWFIVTDKEIGILDLNPRYTVENYDEDTFMVGKHDWRLPTYEEYMNANIDVVGLYTEDIGDTMDFNGRSCDREPPYWCKHVCNNDVWGVIIFGKDRHDGDFRNRGNRFGHQLDREALFRVVRTNKETKDLEWMVMGELFLKKQTTWVEARELAQDINYGFSLEDSLTDKEVL